MYIQYLLGQLTEADRELLEERLFEDDQAFALLNLAEDELIEDYLFDRLSSETRAQFETFYLPLPAHQQKFKLARALHQASAEKSPGAPVSSTSQPVSTPTSDTSVVEFRRPTFWQKLRSGSHLSQLALAASILLSLFGLWLAYRLISSTKPVPQQGQKPHPVKDSSVPAPAPAPSPEPDSVAQDPEKTPEPTPSPTAPKPNSKPKPIFPDAIATLALLPSLSRGSGAEKQLLLSSKIQHVHLELVILDDDQVPSVIAVVKHPDGNVLWKSHILPVKTSPAKRTVTVKLNPAQLTTQTCLIELHPAARDRQSETIATYTFKVVRAESTPNN